MDWIRDMLSRLPADIQCSLAFPAQASFGDFTLPPRKKKKSEASSSRSAPLLQSNKVKRKNDNVYEITTPSEGRPSMELIFFHGFQRKGSQESQQAHLDTRQSEDGTELWLLWILEKFPGARILAISYGLMDMYVTTENLLQNLIQAGVGQNKCPVVLIGHSVGGLVMKELCVSATGKLARSGDKYIKKLLGNLKGLFFFSTPHLGTDLAEKANFPKGCLFEDLEPLNTEAGRRREEFRELREAKGWKASGVVENQPITLGTFEGLIVQEASARCDVDNLYTAQANHFNVCRPHDRSSSIFLNLVTFINDVVKETELQILDEDPVHECRSRLPECPVGLETRAQEVQELLKGGGILGIFGMGGIGKSTLAREVFNNISKSFDYTCFIDNVRGFNINDLEKSVLAGFYHKGRQLDGAKTRWPQMKGKKTLIVMDDIDSVAELRVLPLWQDFADGSCLIMTSRNKGNFKFYKSCVVHEVKFLDPKDATKLFCKHAFDSEDIPQDGTEHLRKNAEAVVEKCGGLPLTLEVMGRYLRNEVANEVWEETVKNLGEARSIDGSQDENDIVWATLSLSYKKLSDEAKDMFRDAATFFFEEPLDTFLVAWSDRNMTATWKNLVDRAMVKEVTVERDRDWMSDTDPFRDEFISIPDRLLGEHKQVWVHEQLRDLAKKLANDTELYDIPEEVNADTRSLRLSILRTSNSKLGRLDPLVTLEQLKYMAVYGFDYLEKKAVSLKGKLRFLRWKSYFTELRYRPKFWISLVNMNDLAVLELSKCSLPNDFCETLGNLLNLRILSLRYCESPARLGSALGTLKNLNVLSLRYVNYDGRSYILPENFGNLSQLKRLELVGVESLTLPESFGRLANLEELTIDAKMIHTLTSSLGGLKSVRKVVLTCHELVSLPNGFGGLSSVEVLKLDCKELKSLPDDFGGLATLRHLAIRSHELETLPGSLGDLFLLEHLELISVRQLRSLPESLGQLANLQNLIISEEFDSECNLGTIDMLPTSFTKLKALRHLVIEAISLREIPDCIKNFPSLHTLELSDLPYVKDLPPWLGKTGTRPLALLSKFFERSDSTFTLTKEAFRGYEFADEGMLEEKARELLATLHSSAMEKYLASDYEGALAILCVDNFECYLKRWRQGFVLQERGILKRMKGDLAGALKDLTAALGIFSEADDLSCLGYPCWKHRGFVNFLLGNHSEAVKDGEMALKLLAQHRHGYTGLDVEGLDEEELYRDDIHYRFLGSLGNLPVKYMHFSLNGPPELWEIRRPSHSQVMEMVNKSDFSGALAVWDAYAVSAGTADYRPFVLQERGILKRYLGDHQGALKDLTAALEMDKDDYECLKHRAYVKFLLGDSDGARIDAERCVALGIKAPSDSCLGVMSVTVLEFTL